jgi:hypothetical protein
MASILRVTTDWVRSHAMDIPGFERLGMYYCFHPTLVRDWLGSLDPLMRAEACGVDAQGPFVLRLCEREAVDWVPSTRALHQVQAHGLQERPAIIRGSPMITLDVTSRPRLKHHGKAKSGARTVSKTQRPGSWKQVESGVLGSQYRSSEEALKGLAEKGRTDTSRSSASGRLLHRTNQ